MWNIMWKDVKVCESKKILWKDVKKCEKMWKDVKLIIDYVKDVKVLTCEFEISLITLLIFNLSL